MEQRDNQFLESNNDQKPLKEKSPLDTDEDPALLMRTEVRPGRFPGSERIRLIHPRHPSLRRVKTGVLEATEETEVPRNGLARQFWSISFLSAGPGRRIWVSPYLLALQLSVYSSLLPPPTARQSRPIPMGVDRTL